MTDITKIINQLIAIAKKSDELALSVDEQTFVSEMKKHQNNEIRSLAHTIKPNPQKKNPKGGVYALFEGLSHGRSSIFSPR